MSDLLFHDNSIIRSMYTGTFQLTTPFTGTGTATTGPANGQCNTDYMTVSQKHLSKLPSVFDEMYFYSCFQIETTAQVTSTDTTGNIGNYPYLCGRNPGQHGRTKDKWPIILGGV